MFVIELVYKADLSEIDAHMAAHVRFLKMRRAIVPELNRIKPWGGLSPVKP